MTEHNGDYLPAEERAVEVLAKGLHATIRSVDLVRCERAARQLVDRLIEHGLTIVEDNASSVAPVAPAGAVEDQQ